MGELTAAYRTLIDLYDRHDLRRSACKENLVGRIEIRHPEPLFIKRYIHGLGHAYDGVSCNALESAYDYGRSYQLAILHHEYVVTRALRHFPSIS